MHRFISLVCLVQLVGLVQSQQEQENATLQNQVLEVLNECICVQHYQCDDKGFIITNGMNIINVKLNEEDGRIICKGGKFRGERLCCKLKSNTETTTEIIVDPKTKPSPPKNLQCGSQRPLITLRVSSGDNDVSPIDGEFPWIAAIFVASEDGAGYTYESGGSLIHPQVILTVNHYFEDTDSNTLKVIVNGRIKIAKVGDDPRQERNVKQIIHHPKYTHGSVYYDAALLILDRPYEINQTKFVNKICLAPPDINLNKLKCIVAGWGGDKETQKGAHAVMRKVELPYVPHSKCEKLLQATDLGEFFDLHNSFICAGGEVGKDACKGDGGSPLMCPFPSGNRYYQIGIVSWGVGCAEANVPGVYTSVPEIRDWIENEVKTKVDI